MKARQEVKAMREEMAASEQDGQTQAQDSSAALDIGKCPGNKTLPNSFNHG